MKRRDKKYSLDQCALYCCSSRKKLFKLLQTSSSKFDEIKNADDLYKEISKEKKNGGIRKIHVPRGDLKRIQKRISELLMRVRPPAFLMSPVRGRSNIDNAANHCGAIAYRLLDVADFYPSCSANKVAEFFSKVMRCPPDVVAILIALTTREEALPQGSPASPILAYWAYSEMWDSIFEITRRDGCDITVYVDDLTLSGDLVRGDTVFAVKKCLRRNGFLTKDSKEVATRETPVLVTGVVVNKLTLLMPNNQHKKRHALKKNLETAETEKEREELALSILGLEETERQIWALSRCRNGCASGTDDHRCDLQNDGSHVGLNVSGLTIGRDRHGKLHRDRRVT